MKGLEPLLEAVSRQILGRELLVKLEFLGGRLPSRSSLRDHFRGYEYGRVEYMV